MKKVLCVGIVTVDIITRPVIKMPDPGLLTPVDSVSMHVGGCAANAACDMKKLGFDPLLVIRTGDDGFADFVKGYLAESGVDLRYAVTDPAHETAATTVIVSSSGERTFLHNPGANDALVSSDVSDEALDECDIVFVAGTFLMHGFDGEECKKLLLRAREKGKFTCLDTAWDFRGGWMKTLAPCIPYLDLFMPSYDEAVELADGEKDLDKLADLFFQMGAKNVVIKCGKDGAFICETIVFSPENEKNALSSAKLGKSASWLPPTPSCTRPTPPARATPSARASSPAFRWAGATPNAPSSATPSGISASRASARPPASPLLKPLRNSSAVWKNNAKLRENVLAKRALLCYNIFLQSMIQ
ncbi:MAG: PfkB family carbohydrate kinase [Clostridia bacterium]|nr:PfkB family carbohydrate kinase [Clostridia bacterium]